MLWIWGAASLFVFQAGSAPAGEVHGRVMVLDRPTTESTIFSRSIIGRYAGLERHRVTAHQAPSRPFPAVVYLLGDASPARAARSAPPVILDQRNEQFVSQVLPIVVGTSVRFLNSDDIYHNVFSLSPTKTFNLGRYPKDQHRDVRFDKPGVISVYCDIHTHMHAFILVLPTRLLVSSKVSSCFSR